MFPQLEKTQQARVVESIVRFASSGADGPGRGGPSRSGIDRLQWRNSAPTVATCLFHAIRRIIGKADARIPILMYHSVWESNSRHVTRITGLTRIRQLCGSDDPSARLRIPGHLFR